MPRAVLLSLFCAAACAAHTPPASPVAAPPEPEPPAPPAEPARDPAAELLAMEARLVDADFALRFEIESSGVVPSRIAGELRSQADRLSLRAAGTFAGQAVEVSLLAKRDRLTGTGAAGKLDLARPEHLKDAIVVGLVRMGILHNLAVLVGGRPPDHAAGGVREWVQATEVSAGEDVVLPDAQTPSGAAVSFALVVGGKPAGEVTVWSDGEVPLARHQVVAFPEGEMRVRETYAFELL